MSPYLGNPNARWCWNWFDGILPAVDLVSTAPFGPVAQPSRLSRELSALVWGAPRWKPPLAAALILPPVLFGATLLIAAVPRDNPRKATPPLRLETESYTPPMVALLDEMRKSGAGGLLAPSGTSVSAVTGPIATPFLYQMVGDNRDRAAMCLATAAWYEAGNDIAGQRAVIQVVLNRVRHPSFPKSVCGVVFQGSERTTGCQFSFTCDGSMSRRIPGTRDWAQARLLADAALNGAVDPIVREATHFHADYVNPWWASKLEPISKVGAHIFYRWAGRQGKLGSGQALTATEAMPLQKPAGATPATATAVAAQPIISVENVATDYPHALSIVGKTEKTRLAVPSKPIEATAKPPEGPRTMLVDAGGPVGRWAISAMDRCAGTSPCRVVAYAHDDLIKSNPLFVFVRDSSGMQVAQWDCDRAPRPNPGQCLPKGAELAALITGR